MTIARISGQAGGATARSASSVSDFYGVDVTAGSLLTIACERGNYPTTTDVAIVVGDLTKTAGTATIGAITLDKQAHVVLGGGDTNIAIFSCIVLTGGSLTFTLAGTIAGEMFALIGIEEHTGSWDSSRVVNTNAGTNSTGAPASGTVTTTTDALFIAALVTVTSSLTTHTEGAGWSLTYEEEDGTTSGTGSTISRVVTGGTTLGATWTAPTTIPWSAIVVAYKEATPPSGGPPGLIGTIFRRRG